MTNEIFEAYGSDPIALCKNWLLEAEKTEINDPEAVNLATADKNGHPSNRMVLIKSITDKGFKFHTNENSQKGREIAENPYASLCFYWKSIRKQIRILGHIKQVEASEADEYFATRSIERKIGAWASQQSTSFTQRAELEEVVKKYENQFSGVDHIPRPPYWKGYLLAPSSLEFWIAHEHRLHTRFIYTHKENGTWQASWLCP